jgi:predicted phosphohydrolase
MLMSDLHLEFDDATIPDFSVVAPILILAGDIGRPDISSLQRFLLAQCERFEHIFFIAGNHCFYQGEYENRLEQLRQLDNLHPHIHFLQNKTYLLPNKLRILGTTFWTYVPPKQADAYSQRLNDYHYISTIVDNEGEKSQRVITVDDTNKWHDQQHTWLAQEIKKAQRNGEHVIIITHHPPSRHDIRLLEYKISAFTSYHLADCENPVRLWIYGHTHKSNDYKINSIRLISNQRGYPGENCGFRPNMKINLYDDGNITIHD